MGIPTTRILDGTKGLAASPIPRDRVPVGTCPDIQNLRVTPGGGALRPWPGFKRTYEYRLLYNDAVGLDDIGVKATGGIALTPGQPTAGNTITIKDLDRTNVYEWYANGGTYSGSNIGVEKGVDRDGSVTNFAAAVEASGTVPLDATADTDNEEVDLEAMRPGIAPNSYTITDDDSDANVTITDMADGVDPTYAYTWYDASGDIPATSREITGKLLIVSFPPQAYRTNGGRGLAVVDQVTGRIVANQLHSGGVPLDVENVAADRLPTILGHLSRQGRHDYPTIMPLGNASHVVTPFDEVWLFDGTDFRRSGIRAPQKPPAVEISAADADETTIVTGTQSASWAYGTGMSADQFAFSASSRGHLNLEIQPAGRFPAEFGHYDQTVVFPTTTVSLKIHCRYDSGRSTKDAVLPEGTWKLVIGSAAAGVGGNIIAQSDDLSFRFPEIHDGEKLTFSVPWLQTDAYTLKSVGIRLVNQIPTDHFASLQAGSVVNFDFDVIEIDSSGSSQLAAGKTYFGVSFVDRARLRESNISPTTSLDLGTGSPFTVDVAGAWSDTLLEGEQNSNPDPRFVDKVNIYIHQSGWIERETNQPIWRRYGQYDIPVADKQGRMVVLCGGERTEEIIFADKEPEIHRRVPPAARNVIPDRNRLVFMNEPGYSVGRCFALGDNAAADSNVLWRLKKWISDTDSTDVVWATVDPSDPDSTGSQESRDWTFDLSEDVWTYPAVTPTWVAWGDTWDESGGEGSTHSTAAAYTQDLTETPQWGPWMEGRSLLLGGSGDLYQIVKALWSATEQDYDRIEFRRFGVDGLVYGLTDGDWMLFEQYDVVARPTRITWTADLSTVGPYNEGIPRLGWKDLDLPGDEIVGAVIVGDWLVAVGRKKSMYLRQTQGVVDDALVRTSLYPATRPAEGGTHARRSLVSVSDDAALMLTPELDIAQITTAGIQRLPISDNLRGWIQSNFRVPANLTRYIHAVWDPRLGWYVLFMADTGIGPDGADETDKFGKSSDGPPEDWYIGWRA